MKIASNKNKKYVDNKENLLMNGHCQSTDFCGFHLLEYLLFFAKGRTRSARTAAVVYGGAAEGTESGRENSTGEAMTVRRLQLWVGERECALRRTASPA